MVKLTIIAEDAKNALGTLKEITEISYTVIVRDATIQRFEYTFEIFWKFLKEGTSESQRRDYMQFPEIMLQGSFQCKIT